MECESQCFLFSLRQNTSKAGAMSHFSLIKVNWQLCSPHKMPFLLQLQIENKAQDTPVEGTVQGGGIRRPVFNFVNDLALHQFIPTHVPCRVQILQEVWFSGQESLLLQMGTGYLGEMEQCWDTPQYNLSTQAAQVVSSLYRERANSTALGCLHQNKTPFQIPFYHSINFKNNFQSPLQ